MDARHRANIRISCSKAQSPQKSNRGEARVSFPGVGKAICPQKKPVRLSTRQKGQIAQKKRRHTAS